MNLTRSFKDAYADSINTGIITVPLNLDQTTKNVTRVEVIDQKGRSYVNWNKNNQVKILMQDDGKTMKIVISSKK